MPETLSHETHAAVGSTQPWLHQHGHEVQGFGTVKQFPLGLFYEIRMYSCERLNRMLADTQILHALYKKHHWLVRGATFYQLHLMLDKHGSEQLVLIDKIAERVQTLGGAACGDPRHAAELTRIPRAPNGCEEAPAASPAELGELSKSLVVFARHHKFGAETEVQESDILRS